MALCAALAGLAGGCQPQWTWSWETRSWQRVEPPAPVVQPNPNLDDPCADRLHDIEGELLLYYRLHGRLPARLDELNNLTSRKVPLTCPTTGKPYAYVPAGLEIFGSNRRVILYDSAPCPPGGRHVIVADPVRPGRPLVIQVPPPMADGPMFTAPIFTAPTLPAQPASAPATK